MTIVNIKLSIYNNLILTINCHHNFEAYRRAEPDNSRSKKEDVPTTTSLIIKKLSLVSIVLDANDDPHILFESLNYKGKPLSTSDLIRNYFFMKIHTEQQEQVLTLTSEWELSNYNFLRKKIYKKIHLKLNTYFETIDRYNPGLLDCAISTT